MWNEPHDILSSKAIFLNKKSSNLFALLLVVILYSCAVNN